MTPAILTAETTFDSLATARALEQAGMDRLTQRR